MSSTLADAYVRIRASTQLLGTDVTAGVTKAAGPAGDKAGKGFASSFLKSAAVLTAASAGVTFFKGAIDEAKESQKVGAQTAAVLKSTGNAAGITAGQIGDLATAISNKTGVDDEAIQSNENLLLTFTNVRNEVGKGNDIFNQATQTISDMSAALGQDGKSSAIQLGKALNDPIKGITALSRVGVSFTDEQKKAITQDVKRGDTLKAQKIILAELSKEFGGSAEAIATPGEKMDVAWGNLQETIGLKLMPVLAKLATILTVVIGYVSDHATAFGILATGIVAIVGAIKLWNIVQAILNAELLANPVGLVVVAIAALVAIIVVVATKTQFFQTIWNAAWGAIKTAFAATMSFLRGNLTGLVLLVLGPVGALAYLALHWNLVWGGIKTGFSATVKFLRGLLADVVGAILGFFGSLIHGAATAFGWVPGIGGKLKTAQKQFDTFAKGVEASIRGIPKTVPINIHATFSATALAAGYLGHHAQGGFIPPGGWSWVGENGAELIQAGTTGATVRSNGDSMAAASAATQRAAGGSESHAEAGGNTFNIHNAAMSPYELAHELDWLSRARG